MFLNVLQTGQIQKITVKSTIESGLTICKNSASKAFLAGCFLFALFFVYRMLFGYNFLKYVHSPFYEVDIRLTAHVSYAEYFSREVSVAAAYYDAP